MCTHTHTCTHTQVCAHVSTLSRAVLTHELSTQTHKSAYTHARAYPRAGRPSPMRACKASEDTDTCGCMISVENEKSRSRTHAVAPLFGCLEWSDAYQQGAVSLEAPCVPGIGANYVRAGLVSSSQLSRQAPCAAASCQGRPHVQQPAVRAGPLCSSQLSGQAQWTSASCKDGCAQNQLAENSRPLLKTMHPLPSSPCPCHIVIPTTQHQLRPCLIAKSKTHSLLDQSGTDC